MKTIDEQVAGKKAQLDQLRPLTRGSAAERFGTGAARPKAPDAAMSPTGS